MSCKNSFANSGDLCLNETIKPVSLFIEADKFSKNLFINLNITSQYLRIIIFRDPSNVSKCLKGFDLMVSIIISSRFVVPLLRFNPATQLFAWNIN